MNVENELNALKTYFPELQQ